jgi:hypothetical protein
MFENRVLRTAFAPKRVEIKERYTKLHGGGSFVI